MNVILFCVWLSAQIFGQNLWGKGDNLEYPGIDWRIILKLIYNKWEYVNWMFFGE